MGQHPVGYPHVDRQLRRNQRPFAHFARCCYHLRRQYMERQQPVVFQPDIRTETYWTCRLLFPRNNPNDRHARTLPRLFWRIARTMATIRQATPRTLLLVRPIRQVDLSTTGAPRPSLLLERTKRLPPTLHPQLAARRRAFSGCRLDARLAIKPQPRRTNAQTTLVRRLRTIRP